MVVRVLSRNWRLVWAVLTAAALIIAGVASVPARAATEPLYVAPTGHYVRGVFRDFWDRNGGVANFGWPITEEYIDPTSGRVLQFFERARFERANPAAVDVQLGLLGREAAGGRVFATSASITNSATRRYFPETSQIVQYGFKQIWETRGGLAIFGLPISGEVQEQADDGQVRTVQYFERVRFEYHPQLPEGQRVLISLLGRRFAPAARTAPLAPNAPPPPVGSPTPPPSSPGGGSSAGGTLARPLVPQARNATVVPLAGQYGQVFRFSAAGFQRNEEVALWSSAPDGTVTAFESRVKADSRGAISNVPFYTDANTIAGVWSIVAQGVDSGRSGVAFLLVVDSAINRMPEPTAVPTPGPGVPADIDARSDPRAGRAGTIFFFDARGFRPGEQVEITVTASDGKKTTSGFTLRADSRGTIGSAGPYYVSAIDAPLGLYSMTATGKESGKVSTAYFVLIP